MTGIETALGVGGAALSIWNVYIHLLLRPLEKDNATLKESLTKAESGIITRVNEVKEEFGSRIAGIHADYKQAHVQYEARISVLERSYLSRAEHAEFRSELMRAVSEVGDRVARSIDALGAKVDHFGERLNQVEAKVK